MGYTIFTGSHILREEDQVEIPMDSANSDYMEFIKWCADGGVPSVVPHPECLAELKTKMLIQLDMDTRAYITSRYSLERQSSLQLLRGDARADGKTNRFDYVNQVVTWVNSVLYYHYTMIATVNACTTKEQLEQLTWDHAANTLPDPEVAIQTAMGIPD
jgi:hypothetical protein